MQEAIRINKREVTIRFFTVGVPEMDLGPIVEASRNSRKR